MNQPYLVKSNLSIFNFAINIYQIDNNQK